MHSALGVSPYQVMYGREANLPGLILDTPAEIDSAMTYSQRVKWALHKVQELIFEKKYLDASRKRFSNLDLEIPKFSPGDRVKMEIPKVRPGASKKLKFIWSGPWEISRQGRNPKVYYLKDDMGVELTNAISVARLMPWNSPEDFPILEDEFQRQPLKIVGSTGDLINYDSSQSEEGTDVPLDMDLEDENYGGAFEGIREGSNPEKKKSKDRTTVDPVKVKPGVLSNIELPDTAANRLLIGHGAKRNAQGKIVFEQRLVPQTAKRRVKQRKILDL
jgi:hypothetical protein